MAMSIVFKPKNYSLLFLDMDSFFASVEQQVQPTLREIPVGVAPYTGDTGCIIAASKEAKKLGIKTGCLVGDAKKIYPKIKIVESRPALYSIYHKEIKKVLEKITPFYQPLSIDEFSVKLSPREQNQVSAKNIAIKIKDQIKNQVGDWLTCSIGVGPNRFLAKMAGESRKPDGITILSIEKIAEFYKSLKSLRDITGINYKMEENLKKININSPISLYNCSLDYLKRYLKHWGRLWYFRLRGYEIDEYSTPAKSISHSHVLAPELRNKQGAQAVLRKLLFKIGYRLRDKKYKAKGICVYIRFYNRQGFKKTISVPPFFDDFSLQKHTFKILEDCDWDSIPSFVYASVYNLESNYQKQINLFDKYEKIGRISRALDDISKTYGPDSIIPASLIGYFETAPDRISFGSPNYEIRS